MNGQKFTRSEASKQRHREHAAQYARTYKLKHEIDQTVRKYLQGDDYDLTPLERWFQCRRQQWMNSERPVETRTLLA